MIDTTYLVDQWSGHGWRASVSECLGKWHDERASKQAP